jgi:hypothetical protein
MVFDDLLEPIPREIVVMILTHEFLVALIRLSGELADDLQTLAEDAPLPIRQVLE